MHEYLSTACWHELNDNDPDLHTSCRQTCKTCDRPCSCPSHPTDDDPTAPPAWVDQARDLAVELLALVDLTQHPELAERIATDRHLFWARNEVQQSGEWRPE